MLHCLFLLLYLVSNLRGELNCKMSSCFSSIISESEKNRTTLSDELRSDKTLGRQHQSTLMGSFVTCSLRGVQEVMRSPNMILYYMIF